MNQETKVEYIPISSIRDPEMLLRKTIDDTALEDLYQSIVKVGILEPLIVRRTGEDYILIAGHRRLMAARLANLETVPCIVKEAGCDDFHKIRLHENYGREDVNPVDEGEYFAALVEKYGMSVDEIVQATGLKQAYVENRIALTNLQPKIRDLLREGTISIEAARELWKVKNIGDLDVMIQTIKESGASTKTIRLWVEEWQKNKGTIITEIVEMRPVTKNNEAVVPMWKCEGCLSNKTKEEMRVVWICSGCIQMIWSITRGQV